MAIKPEPQLSLTHEQRVERLQQLTTDLARAVDMAEEQRRALRDIARDASELAEALTPDPSEPTPPSGRRPRRPGKKR